THNYNLGRPPDHRAQAAALARGIDLGGLRARQICRGDFLECDKVLAMDRENLAFLQHLCPHEHARKLHLFMEYSTRFTQREIPDPYYGETPGFETVLDMIEDAANGLWARISRGLLRTS
ncbi:MAG: low molecular weight protein-tyrosine-phosphatase, partial [Burkholderiales bacterium]